MFSVTRGKLKLSLVLLLNIAVWVYFYAYFSGQPFVFKSNDIALPHDFVKNSLHYGLALNAVIFYFNYYILINKYMTRSMPRYLAVSGALILLLTLIETAADLYILREGFADKLLLSTMLFTINVSVHSIFWLLSATLKSSVNWVSQERIKNAVNAQRIDAELSLLKSQIHPHFLFNTLNTLYSSAYQFGDNKTADGIGKLSHLLRYMLYETASPKVELDKEVEYLENYIELQQMRFSNEVDVSFVVEGEVSDYKIVPMLLITLVENAFKHGISPAVSTEIKILLTVINDTQLTFTVENAKLSARRHHLINEKAGGVGLDNLRKRLALLYPKHHHFATETLDDKFIARLELT